MIKFLIYQQIFPQVLAPSLCLLGVTIMTSFINTEHFEANIMVYLTTMLVMYTLFQTISISLPQVELWRYNLSLRFHKNSRLHTWSWLISGFSLVLFCPSSHLCWKLLRKSQRRRKEARWMEKRLTISRRDKERKRYKFIIVH